MTLSFVDEDEGIPRWVDGFAELETNVEVTTKDSAWKLYVASLYFVTYTITSVGYGDIGPKNIIERVVCIVMIFACGIAWAYVLGQVCGIVGNMDVHETQFRQNMDDVNNMMRERHLPKKMQRRIRSFFLSTKVTQRIRMQEELLHR